jgi:hypothetical protein
MLAPSFGSYLGGLWIPIVFHQPFSPSFDRVHIFYCVLILISVINNGFIRKMVWYSAALISTAMQAVA